MILQAIKVSQPLGDFYIAKIKATDLLSISTSSVARYDKDGVLRGNQRPLDPPRLRLIANFIKSQEMSFPTSILVAANINQQGNIIEAPDSRWSIEETNISNVYTITVPDGVTTCLIIDGQHRLNAFKCVDKDFQEIELVCSIFIDLPNPYQAYLFATINGNQKKVDKSLALELFGYDVEDKPANTWSPEKLAVYLTRKFNFTKGSPLYQRIRLAPLFSNIQDSVDKSKWLLSTAAMVEGIMLLISSNPQMDRDFLAMKHSILPKTNNRSDLKKLRDDNKKDKSVLRSLYLECKDEEIYDIIFRYFIAVKEILWEEPNKDSVIFKTIGISVLFELLKSIIEQNGIQDSYISYIQSISDLDYTNNYFSLSGIGKTRLRRILKFKMGLIDENKLKEEDLEYFMSNAR